MRGIDSKGLKDEGESDGVRGPLVLSGKWAGTMVRVSA